MACSSSINDLSGSANAVILTENDVPGAFLLERKPEGLKNSEQIYSLKCRDDTVKRSSSEDRGSRSRQNL